MDDAPVNTWVFLFSLKKIFLFKKKSEQYAFLYKFFWKGTEIGNSNFLNFLLIDLFNLSDWWLLFDLPPAGWCVCILECMSDAYTFIDHNEFCNFAIYVKISLPKVWKVFNTTFCNKTKPNTDSHILKITFCNKFSIK